MFGGEPPNYIFSIFSFIGFILVCIPFPWHLHAWNTSTCLFMVWTGLGCLNSFINSIVWNKNIMNWAPVWCDISSRYIIGAAVGIPAASLCINRRLYLIITVGSVIKTKAEKRREVMLDLAIGVGIPILEMILQYIVQGHRFNIYEDIGCWPATYNTPYAYLLVFSWPVVIALVSAVYCSLTIRALLERRSEFNELLAANSNLSSSRYFRLMGLAAVDLCLGIPWTSYSSIYVNLRNSSVQPWISWDNVHYHFSDVDQWSAIEWKQSSISIISLEVSRWASVICAFIFFAFFGFAQEARKNYRLAFNSVARRVGYTRPGSPSGVSGSFGMKQSNKSTTDESFMTDLTFVDLGSTLDEVKDPYSPTASASWTTRDSYERKSLSDASLHSHSPPLHHAHAPACV